MAPLVLGPTDNFSPKIEPSNISWQRRSGHRRSRLNCMPN